MRLIARSHPFLAIPTEEAERYVAEAQDRITWLRLSALRHIGEWELIFSQYFTYTEVWGQRPRGLTEEELMEARLAYEEWNRLNRAYQKWEKSKIDSQFDRVGYIEKRKEEILENG